MLIMRSSPAFARTREPRAKIRSHMSLERTGKAFEKYWEHDDSSPVHVLKHARMKTTAISLSPNAGERTDAVRDSISAPVEASVMKDEGVCAQPDQCKGAVDEQNQHGSDGSWTSFPGLLSIGNRCLGPGVLN